MRYLAVLGRQPEISLAELEMLFQRTTQIGQNLATFSADFKPEIARLGGSLKIAEEMREAPIDFLRDLPDGKITLGVSDYSKRASARKAQGEALKLKKILVRHGRSVRVVENKEATLSTATSLHNGLAGGKTNKVELILVEDKWWRVIGVQDIEAYAQRDQARPARDAKVGMLPPKLAQILINLCGELPNGARVLDPFCGTGVVLQEAILMGYQAYGTDISEKMVEYSERNLAWLTESEITLFLSPRPSRPSSRETWAIAKDFSSGALRGAVAASQGAVCPSLTPSEKLSTIASKPFSLSVGDATKFQWEQPIDAVACEGYLGRPMSLPPAEIKLKEEKQTCGAIILGFLKNLGEQVRVGTPVVMAIPAWLRPDGSYSRLGIVDEIRKLGYNVMNKSGEGLLYYRDGQVVAREIIILRKK